MSAMNIIRADSTDEFVRLAVQWLIGIILEEQKDPDHQVVIGLSGGSTPGPVYTKLAIEKSIDWERVLFFLVDDRYVPAGDKDSNQKMLWDTMLIHNATKARTLLPNTSLPLEDCVRTYDDRIRNIQPDAVVLGMGEDGHIASLFPPVGPEAYGPAKVIHTTTDKFAVKDRISVTFPVLLRASRRLFLIAGEKKSALLAKMQSSGEDVSLYPAQYLFDERTTWIVSKA